MRSGLPDLLMCMDPTAPERIQEELVGLTSTRTASEKGWGRENLVRISAAVDIAFWNR
jgi:hypothetical protein